MGILPAVAGVPPDIPRPRAPAPKTATAQPLWQTHGFVSVTRTRKNRGVAPITDGAETVVVPMVPAVPVHEVTSVDD